MNETDNSTDQNVLWFSETLKLLGRSEIIYRLYSRIRCGIQKYINNTFEATKIVDNLWLGSLASASNLEALQERNIKTVVNTILGGVAMYPFDINYERVKLRDVEDEDIIAAIEKLVPIIHEKLQAGEGILTHCVQGRSRSATIVAAYLIRYHHMTAEEAVAFIKDKRTQVEPNPGYIRQLHEYEQKVRSYFVVDDNKKNN